MTQEVLASWLSPHSPPASSIPHGSQVPILWGGQGAPHSQFILESRAQALLRVEGHLPGATSVPPEEELGKSSRDGGSTTLLPGQPQAPAAPWRLPGMAASIACEGGVLGIGARHQGSSSGAACRLVPPQPLRTLCSGPIPLQGDTARP